MEYLFLLDLKYTVIIAELQEKKPA